MAIAVDPTGGYAGMTHVARAPVANPQARRTLSCLAFTGRLPASCALCHDEQRHRSPGAEVRHDWGVRDALWFLRSQFIDLRRSVL